MSKPPTPTQRTYRGRIRADMRSAANHLARLYAWNQRYLTGPVTNYPNQLYTTNVNNTLAEAQTQLILLLNSKGPIPLTRS